MGKVLTLDQHKKRRWSLVNMCFSCKAKEEFMDHILLYCLLVRILGKLFFNYFGIHWVQAATVKEALVW